MDTIDLELLVRLVAQLSEHDTRAFLRQLGRVYHARGQFEGALDLFMIAAKLNFERRP